MAKKKDNFDEELRLARLLHRRAQKPSDFQEVRAILLRNARAISPEYVEQAWDEYNDLLKLLDINLDINSEHNLSRLLDKIIDTVIEVVNAERGYLVLLDDGGKMRFEAARGIDRTDLSGGAPRAISRSILERVIASDAALITNNAEEDERFADFASVQDFQLRSIMCAPLKTRRGVIGAVYVDNKSIKGNFAPKDLELLETLCAQAAIAAENAQLVEDNIKKQQNLIAAKQEVDLLNKELARKIETQSSELAEVRRSLEQSRRFLETKYNYENIVGQSPAMRAVFRLLDRTTDSDVPVLILGESGTGKELVARAIHFNGPRKHNAFISENASSISESLFESELFGHAKGAFTGAFADHKGLFELADKGTLFLDEIGNLSLDMQSKLLRVLENGEIRRVGGKETRTVSVRIVTATNKDLVGLVRKGLFREDLYYRLNVIKIEMPPLRERREDIPPLARHFLREYAESTKTAPKTLSPEAETLLTEYAWPGNVRELENEIRRLVVLSGNSPVITGEFVSSQIHESPHPSVISIPEKPCKLQDIVEDVEKKLILGALEKTRGNKSRTARVLGLSRDGLRKKMMRYDINPPGFQADKDTEGNEEYS